MRRVDTIVALAAILLFLASGTVTTKSRDRSQFTGLPTGAQPVSIVASRFNRDAHLDLAVANLGSDTISVFFGRGNGTFHKAAVWPTGPGPRSLQAADVNEDGAVDLLAADHGSNTISVLLGTGKGTFAPRVAVPVADAMCDFGCPPLAILATDVDADGHVDVAVAYVGSNRIGVLLGAGDGSFTRIDAAGFVRDDPQALVAGDFNGDGRLDLASANLDVTVSTLVGNGDGTFATGAEYSTGSMSFSLAVTDMNGDGFLDLVVANHQRPEPFVFGRNSVSVLLGDGAGHFSFLPEVEVGARPVAVLATDFNRDGNADVAVANFEDDRVSILYGTGDGSLVGRTDLRTGAGPVAVASGDFNRDRWSDVAVANQFADTAQVFLLNSKQGSRSH